MNFGIEKEPYPHHDSDEFLELQMRAKLEFDKLVNGYRAMYRVAGAERVNHSLTEERRRLLRGIMAVDNVLKYKNGETVIYWDKVLEYAHKAVAAFNREDVQRGN